MYKTAIGFILVLWLVFGPAGYLVAQEPPKVAIEPRSKNKTERVPRDVPIIRADSTLVAVGVTVADELGRIVTGLEKEHFRVFEGRAEQQIAHFANEDTPVAVGFVVDISGSMGEKFKKSREAVAQFCKMANPEDQFFLVQFSDRPELAAPLTKNAGDIQNRLLLTKPEGRTALLDGIMLAMSQMKSTTLLRKALLIISDGGDNSSRYSSREIKREVREADVQIYAIGIFEPLGARDRTAEELAGPFLLNEITELTGGRHFPVMDANELPDVAAKIGTELRNQYVLYYNPRDKKRDGKYRRIRVQIDPPRGMPPLRVYHRSGYYAPSQ